VCEKLGWGVSFVPTLVIVEPTAKAIFWNCCYRSLGCGLRATFLVGSSEKPTFQELDMPPPLFLVDPRLPRNSSAIIQLLGRLGPAQPFCAEPSVGCGLRVVSLRPQPLVDQNSGGDMSNSKSVICWIQPKMCYCGSLWQNLGWGSLEDAWQGSYGRTEDGVALFGGGSGRNIGQFVYCWAWRAEPTSLFFCGTNVVKF